MNRVWLCLAVVVANWIGIVDRAIAQAVISDGSLNTVVTTNNGNFTITNGNLSGNNLFHSFREFSIPTGGSATFDLINTPNATTIFSRVTGSTASSIDGLIKTINSSNPVSLFLLNPNGILFGPNASLNMGGSFVGTTATSIKFADGVEFSAANASGTPLLTLSVPIGLQMGQKPGNITVQGTGHPLYKPTLFPILGTANNLGLSVKPGQTLALIGGDITLNGGILTAADGHLELGSVQNGEISVQSSSKGWQFSYNTIQNFKDIRLLQKALADTSGLGGASIQVQGNNIDIQDGSLVLLRNFGFIPSGTISIDAANTLNINGALPDGSFGSGIVSQVLGTGAGGKTFVRANQALLSGGGAILGDTYSSAAAGDLIIDVANTLKLSGRSLLNPLLSSAITSTTFADGKAGNLSISTQNLMVKNGGILSTTTFGKGEGGDLTINAANTVEISIDDPLTVGLPSAITAETIVAGEAGDLRINTGKLSMSGGGKILASTRGSGKAGDIIIHTSESIELTGEDQSLLGLGTSTISSNAEPLPAQLQLIFGSSPSPSGNSGSIEINTPILKIDHNAEITVGHFGTGNAGDLQIQAGAIYLNHQGQISAATESGEGGHISLQARDLLMLRKSSWIHTDAKGTGNGGNITINSPIILGLENSDIIANAIDGRGGNITITTQGMFGLQLRDRTTPENDITASSEVGVDGTVQVNTIGVDPNAGLIQLPSTLVDPSQNIAAVCLSDQKSSFVATGRGGIPIDPSQETRSNRTWQDLRPLSETRQANGVESAPVLVEATGWERDSNGKVQLIAEQPVQNEIAATCASN